MLNPFSNLRSATSSSIANSVDNTLTQLLEEMQQYVVLVEGSHYIVDLDFWRDENSRESSGQANYRQYTRSELLKAILAEGYDRNFAEKLLAKFQGSEKTRSVNPAYDIESLPLRPAGYQVIGGTPWFTHHASTPMNPIPGDPTAVIREICLMFGKEAPLFIGWLRGAYTRQLNFAAEARGEQPQYKKVASQTLAIVGSQGTGKTHVLLDLIIQGLLGPYTNMPAAWLTGESRFNDWALKSNIWVADDGVSLQGMAKRKHAATVLKNAGYSSKQTIECKNKSIINLDFPCERIFVVNLQEQALRALPAHEENEDKYLFLYNCAPSGLMSEWAYDFAAFEDAIKSAMPAFAHWILNEYNLPGWAITNTNRHSVADFGYMSPEVMKALSEQDEVGLLMSRLRKCYSHRIIHSEVVNQWLSQEQLRSFMESIEHGMDRTTPTKMGILLGQCIKRWPDLLESRIYQGSRQFRLIKNPSWGSPQSMNADYMDIAEPDPILLTAAGLIS